MANIRIGVQLAPQHTSYPDYARMVRAVEDLGVDTIWDWDHFFPPWDYPQKGDHFEAWTLLTAMATLTQRAEVGCLVTCNNYRNPALLAAMAKTVDHISNGRLILGLGAGWFEAEYRDYGYTFGTSSERLQALEANLVVIKQHLQEELPLPVRLNIPILIGGDGEKVTLRIVAQHADIWNSGASPVDFKYKNTVLDRWCENCGRDPALVERSVTLYNVKDPSVYDEYVAAGAQHIILNLSAPWDLAPMRQLVQ